MTEVGMFCNVCGGKNHISSRCPFRESEAKAVARQKESYRETVENGGENPFLENYNPLRKKLKRASTGKEDNFMESYYHPIQQMTEQEAIQIRLENNIEVEGESVPWPVRSFSELGLPIELLNQLQKLGYKSPTGIQMQSIPCTLSGRDIIGLAETGSGKTLSYLLPMLMFIKDKPTANPGAGPLAIILAPTRELVDQIFMELDKFLNPQKNPFLVGFYLSGQRSINNQQRTSKFHKILSVCGGVPLSSQAQPIQRVGIDVIVATPGRLIDLLEKNIVTMDRLSYLVFDEADRMLSMNMEEQLRRIVSYASICPRQTLLFTATMPISVIRLARSAVMNSITIQVGSVGSLSSSVNQNVIFVHSFYKKNKLLEVLRSIPKPPVLVFCNNQYTVDKIVKFLRSEQFHVAGMHSLKTQPYRFRAMRAFKEGQLDILVATDLVSRGIDVVECKNVIIFDMPDSIEDYVHRSGRTGRFGREGVCTALLTYGCTIARELKKLLKESGQTIPKELEDARVFGGQIIKTELGDTPQRSKLK